jgi:hypothetical protein
MKNDLFVRYIKIQLKKKLMIFFYKKAQHTEKKIFLNFFQKINKSIKKRFLLLNFYLIYK